VPLFLRCSQSPLPCQDPARGTWGLERGYEGGKWGGSVSLRPGALYLVEAGGVRPPFSVTGRVSCATPLCLTACLLRILHDTSQLFRIAVQGTAMLKEERRACQFRAAVSGHSPITRNGDARTLPMLLLLSKPALPASPLRPFHTVVAVAVRMPVRMLCCLECLPDVRPQGSVLQLAQLRAQAHSAHLFLVARCPLLAQSMRVHRPVCARMCAGAWQLPRNTFPSRMLHERRRRARDEGSALRSRQESPFVPPSPSLTFSPLPWPLGLQPGQPNESRGGPFARMLARRAILRGASVRHWA